MRGHWKGQRKGVSKQDTNNTDIKINSKLDLMKLKSFSMAKDIIICEKWQLMEKIFSDYSYDTGLLSILNNELK